MPLFYTENGFISAAAQGDMETLKKYVASPKVATLRYATDDDGRTALHRAVENGHVAAARLLLEKGSDIFAKTKSGRGVLHMAAGLPQPDMLAFLLEHTPDLDANAQTNDKDSPLHMAVYRNRIENTRLLLEAGAPANDRKALLSAFRYGHSEIADMLLTRGADPRAISDEYYSYRPLHYIAQNGNLQLLELLLKQDNIDLDARSKDGNTALHQAAYNGYVPIVEALVAAGATLDIENGDGLTPVELALKKDKTQAAKIIQQAQREQQEKATRESLYSVPGVTALAPGAQDTENWVRLGTDKIAHIGVYPTLERKLTEIFNFSTQERLTISENLRTGTENTLPPQGFDSLPDAALDAAYAAFEQQGGTAERNHAFKKKLSGKPGLT